MMVSRSEEVPGGSLYVNRVFGRLREQKGSEGRVHGSTIQSLNYLSTLNWDKEFLE